MKIQINHNSPRKLILFKYYYILNMQISNGNKQRKKRYKIKNQKNVLFNLEHQIMMAIKVFQELLYQIDLKKEAQKSVRNYMQRPNKQKRKGIKLKMILILKNLKMNALLDQISQNLKEMLMSIILTNYNTLIHMI